MVLTVLESIPSPKFLKIFGVSLEPLLEFSRWEKSLMAILHTSVFTKTTSPVYLIILCTTRLRMSSAQDSTWAISSKGTTLAPNITKTPRFLAFLSTTTTTHASLTLMLTKKPNLKTLQCFLWLVWVYLLYTTVLSSTTQEVMTLKIASLCGKRWTPQVISIKSSKKWMPSAKNLQFGMKPG